MNKDERTPSRRARGVSRIPLYASFLSISSHPEKPSGRKPHKAIDLEISPTRLSHNSVSGFGLLIDLPIPPQKKIGLPSFRDCLRSNHFFHCQAGFVPNPSLALEEALYRAQGCTKQYDRFSNVATRRTSVVALAQKRTKQVLPGPTAEPIRTYQVLSNIGNFLSKASHLTS